MKIVVDGCYPAGSGFAERADVDPTIHYAIKAWATWFGQDECRGCVNTKSQWFLVFTWTTLELGLVPLPLYARTR